MRDCDAHQTRMTVVMGKHSAMAGSTIMARVIGVIGDVHRAAANERAAASAGA